VTIMDFIERSIFGGKSLIRFHSISISIFLPAADCVDCGDVNSREISFTSLDRPFPGLERDSILAGRSRDVSFVIRRPPPIRRTVVNEHQQVPVLVKVRRRYDTVD